MDHQRDISLRRGNVANLRPFRPGVSGNPKGRPRKAKIPNDTGILSPQFRHGLYSRFLPTPYRNEYERARAHPELARLENHLALLHVRLSMLFTHTQAHPGPDALTAFRRLTRAIEAHDPAEHRAATEELSHALANGDGARWREIRQVLEQQRRTCETITKQKFLEGQYTRDETVWEIFRGLACAVHENVSDRETLRKIKHSMEVAMGIEPQTQQAQIAEGQNLQEGPNGNGDATDR